MQNVRTAFAEMIVRIPRPISKAFDLQKVLDVDPKLASRVFRVAHADDPLSVGTEVPSRVSIERVFRAAAKQGVPAKVIERASAAYEQFEELVAEHAGDRDSFASMVSALSGDEESAIDVQHRRAAFIANSHIIGVQARTRLVCQIFAPAAAQPLADSIPITGFIDLRWLRADNVPVVLANDRCDVTTERGVERRGIVPIDEKAHRKFGGALLQDYCSHPIAGIETVEETDGFVKTVLRSHEVGNSSNRTYIVGTRFASPVSLYRAEGNATNILGAYVGIPCQTLVHDVMIHESFVLNDPTARAYSEHEGGRAQYKNTAVPLLQKVTVSYLGNGAEVLHTRDVPRYAEMVEDVAKRVGFELAPLRVYRCRVEYPFMPSSVVMYFDAPEMPSKRGKRNAD